MTLVHLLYLNSNITHSKWAVLLPGLFAGTFAGLVFIWRCAILVDSIDTLSDIVCSAVGIKRSRAAVGLSLFRVAKLIVEFGSVVPQPRVGSNPRSTKSGSDLLPRWRAGCSARTLWNAKPFEADPTGVL